MRILFIGTVIFSEATLKKLLEIGANVVGVITKSASEFNADYADLMPLCQENGIPYKLVNDINHPNNVAWIQNLAPDVIYCFGWSSLIKKDLLATAPKGVVGFHPAALPNNRGRHPLIWALVLGLKKTASTFFLMDEGADTGDIISQEPIDILDSDNAQTLYQKVTKTALTQVVTFTKALESNTLVRQKQPVEGNSWRKRGQADGRIDFRMHSVTIYNLVRALTRPYVGAHLEINGNSIKVWKANMINWLEDNLEPGKILKIDGRSITVKTADGAIELIEHEFNALLTEGTYL